MLADSGRPGPEKESKLVYKALESGDIIASRKAVSMIVGRDTAALDDAAVTRAAVETVAENTSDGVVAPLLFLAIGGAPLGFFLQGGEHHGLHAGLHRARPSRISASSLPRPTMC